MNQAIQCFLASALITCGVLGYAADRPNIVVILCDDLGYGDLECYGHPHIKTPHLNALAESGIRLTDCYSAAPVCSPSRVGLLTGRSPNRAGVYDWIPEAKNPRPDARDQVHMRREEWTIAKLLQSAGYATCMSGKWHCNSKFNSDAQPQPGDFGFDHWFGTQNNAAPSHENPNNYVRNGEAIGEREGFSCQIAAQEAMDWMTAQVEKSPEQPFFVYLAFHEPHEPVASPQELVDDYAEVATEEDEAQYFANVTNMDLAVGKVVARLRELERLEDTIIYFSSDNGPETLDRYPRANRSWGRPTPLRGMKLWTTDAGFRVAGIVSWPSRVQAGQVSSQVVSSLDLLPTFCGLAGISPPKEIVLDGTDISALFAGEKIQREKPLVWCYYNAINEHRVAMRDGPWKVLARLDALPKYQNVFNGNREQILAAPLVDFEIYRIREDLHESNNLASDVEDAELLKEKLMGAYRELAESSHYWSVKETRGEDRSGEN